MPVVIVETAPAILATRRASTAADAAAATEALSAIEVCTDNPSYLRVAASTIPTLKLEAVTGDNDVLDLGSLVSLSLNVLPDSS